MSLQVGELFAMVTANDAPFRNTMNNVESRMQSVGQTLMNSGKTMTMAVTAPIAGLIGFGVKYNSTMQDLQTSFKVMLGSQEAAVAMTDKLIKMGAQTPFESTQLAEYTKTMLAFGYTADNVIPIMSRIGDISLGNNEKMSSLTRTMGQINALGKLQGGDLNQLIGQGWNPLNNIMKRTGETTEQVRKRMEAGKVSYKEVEQALIDSTSAGGQFYKGMEEGSKTLSGQVSTLKDTFSMLAGELTKPIFDKLLEVIPTIIQKVTDLSDWFKSLSPEMKNQILIVGGIVSAMGPLLMGMGFLSSILSKVFAGFKIISGIIGFLLSPIGLIVVAIAALVGVFIWLYNTNEDFRKKVNEVWDQVSTYITDVVKKLLPVIEDTFKNIVSVVQEVGPQVWDAIKTLFGRITEILVQIMTDIGPGLKSMFMTLVTDIQSAIEALIPVIKNALDFIWQIINDVLTLLIDAWNSWGKTLWDNLVEAFNNICDWLTQLFNDFLLPLVQKFIDGWRYIWDEGLKNLVDKVGGFVGRLANFVMDIWNNFISPIVSFLLDVLVPVFRDIGLTIMDVMKNLITGISNILGGLFDILNGIIDFLTGVFTGDWSKAWEGLKEIARGIMTALKGVYELTLGQIKDIFQGIWKIIMDDILKPAWSWLTGVFSKVWDEIKSKFTTAINGIKSTVENVFNSIKSFIQGIMEDIKGKFEWLYNHNYIFKNLVDTIKAIFTKFKTEAIEIWNGITSKISGIWNDIKDTATSIFSSIKSFISGIWGGVKSDTSDAWSSVWSTITDIASNIYSSVTGTFTDIKNKIGEVIQDAYNWGKNLIGMMVQGIKDGAGTVADAASNIGGTIFKFMGFHSPTEAGPCSDADTWAPNLIKMFANGLTSNKPQVESAAKEIAESLKTQFGESSKSVEQIMKDLNNTTMEGIETQLSSIELRNNEEERLNKERENNNRRAELERKISESKDDEDRKSAQSELNEFLLDQEKQRTTDSLNIQKEYLNRLKEQVQKQQTLVKDNANKLNDALMSALKSRLQEELDYENANIDESIANAKMASSRRISILQQEYDQRVSLLNSETSAAVKERQRQIDAINKLTKDENKATKVKKNQEEVQKLTLELKNAKTPEDKVEAQKALNEKLIEIQREAILESRQTQIEALQTEIENIQDSAEEKLKQYKTELESKKQHEQELLQSDLRYWNDLQTQTTKKYEEKMSAQALQAEAEKLMVGNQQDEIITLLQTYNPDWYEAGKTFGEKLIEGLNSTKSSIQNAVSSIMSQISSVSSYNPSLSFSPKTGTNIFGNLPGLASGGIVSRPTLAMIGEGVDSEAVTPISKLQSMIDNSVEKAMSSYGTKGSSQPLDLTLKLDSRQFARLVVPAINNENNRVGTVAIRGV